MISTKAHEIDRFFLLIYLLDIILFAKQILEIIIRQIYTFICKPHAVSAICVNYGNAASSILKISDIFLPTK